MLKNILSNIRNIFNMKDKETQERGAKSTLPTEVCISIFFDTNQLGERFSDEGCGDMILYCLKGSQNFKDIIKYIQTYSLQDNVKLLIPELVLKEYKRQTIEIFLEHTKSLEPKLDSYKKVFGDILVVDFHFKYNNLSSFEAHIDELIQNFLSENNCQIACHSEKEQAFDRLIDKAINREAPFTEAHKDRKKYKDAGFKDAIIEDIIIRHAKSTNNISILVSDDNDWGRCFQKENNIYVCKNTDQVIQIINKLLGLNKADLIARRFLNDLYLRETAITMASLKYDKSAEYKIIQIEENTEDENFILLLEYLLDGTNCRIECVYEDVSNSVISSEFIESND